MQMGPLVEPHRYVLLREGLDWVAKGLPNVRKKDGSLNIARFADYAGVSQDAIGRAMRGEVIPFNDTMATLAQLGAQVRGVTWATAQARLFANVAIRELAAVDEQDRAA